MATEDTPLLGEEFATDLSRSYWEGLHRGELVLQRCQTCGRWQHYPRRLCRWCWGGELESAPVAGTGTLIASALSHRTPKRALRERLPMNLGLVRLAEGPVVLGLLIGQPSTGHTVVHDGSQTLRTGLLTFAARP